MADIQNLCMYCRRDWKKCPSTGFTDCKKLFDPDEERTIWELAGNDLEPYQEFALARAYNKVDHTEPTDEITETFFRISDTNSAEMQKILDEISKTDIDNMFFPDDDNDIDNTEE